MGRKMNYITVFVISLWMAPQNVIGGLLLLFVKRIKVNVVLNRWMMPVVVARTSSFMGAISLGNFVIMDRYSNIETLDHEMGHTIQSMMLGPLYLLVVGLPSITWGSLRILGLFRKRSYYWFYTESWADKISGIKR